MGRHHLVTEFWFFSAILDDQTWAALDGFGMFAAPDWSYCLLVRGPSYNANEKMIC